MALRQKQRSQEKRMLGTGVRARRGLVGVAMAAGESPCTLCT